MTKFIPFVFFLVSASFAQQKSSWEIWIVSNTYTLNQGETLDMVFGITGYGPLDPVKLKICLYSEENTLIKYGKEPAQYDTYIIAPSDSAPKDRFTKMDSRTSPNQIVLECDHNSQFGHVFLTPETSGDKRLLMIATYSSDSLSFYTTSREFNYHVNSFTERYQTHLTLSAIFLGLVAIPFVGNLMEFLRNKFKKR